MSPRVVVLFLFLTAAAACSGAAPAGAPAGAPGASAPAMPVEVLTLTTRPLEQSGEFVGIVKSRRSTTIQPQAEGILTTIAVTSGDRVAAGATLFEIDAAPQQAAVASLESIRVAREADAALAKQNADRARTLVDVGAISRQEFDQAATLEKTAAAQLRATEDQIRQQRAELAHYRVVASTPGIVGDIPVRQGDRVTRGTVLTTLDEAGALEVYVGIPVHQAPGLKPGLALRILGDAGEVLATERVSFVAPSVDDGTQTVLVKAPLASTGGRFRTDQFVRAQIVFATAPGLTIPVTAVTRINGQYFAFIAEKAPQGTVVRQRAITVGVVVGNDYVVGSGVKAGEQLIVSGIQKIGDGMPVAPMPAASAAPAGGA
jgi:RND family efflux transporter MFP subunit